MNHQNIVAKLNQIVEQAQLTLQDPHSLTSERQRMIIALARFVCTEMRSGGTSLELATGTETRPPLA